MTLTLAQKHPIVMNYFLSWVVLVMAFCPLLAHPITESAEIPYPELVSMKDRGVGRLDEISLSEHTFTPQDVSGFRYSALIPGEINRDGVRTTGLLPKGLKSEVLLEKHLQNPFIHMLGIHKQFRKRGENSECFWKYCV
ncbi:urotensin-2-like [Dunckerocampus dactyliophorus]|uniref:urotensin-2-like n=1 Tax=Dunckerocampus dactyliophorus TaxID=161453 RepID=UPI002406C5A3|nr:urotensin-2-like [Dunckerocampus dactyliophorus]